MKIEIDQSGKIEHTNRKTIIAFSNSNNGAIVISGNDKKTVQRYFRSIGKPRLFIYVAFVALIYLLIKDHVKNGDQVIVDREYPGYESFIRKSLKNLVQKLSGKDVTVSIWQIGKKSTAHDLAWKELKMRVQNLAKRVTYDKVIAVIKKSGNI